MSKGAPKSQTGAATASGAEADTEYRVVSVQRSTAPSGSTGSDWHMYRIAQGKNVIRGYRRGDVASVTADAEKIVSGLNERRNFRRGRVDLRPSRRAAATTPATPAAAAQESEET